MSVGGTDLVTASAGGPWKSETAWVDSGGGISPDGIAIPAWQKLSGVINSSNRGSTTLRNGPDVSANANFTFYVCADQTTCTANSYGGTSFAAPMWAGFIALVNQQLANNGDKPIGFINPSIYTENTTGGDYATDFHDITSGTSGSYSAVTGYDLVTGWGSPTAGLIATLAGGGSSGTPDFTISASPNSVSVVQGAGGSSSISTSVSGGFNSAIALSASGQPSGVTVTFNPTSIAAPGSGSSSMSITVASTVATGTYSITVTGTGDGVTHTANVTLIVTSSNPASFTLSAPASLSVARSGSKSGTVTTTIGGSFSSAISLSASGMESGETVTFSPNPIAAPGSGSSTITVKATRKAALGTRNITITATGGGITHTATVAITVVQ